MHPKDSTSKFLAREKLTLRASTQPFEIYIKQKYDLLQQEFEAKNQGDDNIKNMMFRRIEYSVKVGVMNKGYTEVPAKSSEINVEDRLEDLTSLAGICLLTLDKFPLSTDDAFYKEARIRSEKLYKSAKNRIGELRQEVGFEEFYNKLPNLLECDAPDTSQAEKKEDKYSFKLTDSQAADNDFVISTPGSSIKKTSWIKFSWLKRCSSKEGR
jgi:hypothetical protein